MSTSTTAPYWGQLPAPKARRLSEDGSLAPDRRQSLDAAAYQPQGQPRQNRDSTQTTNTDIMTDTTYSSLNTPNRSSFQGQGLAPRPPSLPYGANQYPPELLENRRRRRSRNQDQDYDYTAHPTAPTGARAPPASSKNGRQPYPASGAPPRTTRRPDGPISPMDSSFADRQKDLPVLDRTRDTLESAMNSKARRNGTEPSVTRSTGMVDPSRPPQRRGSVGEPSRKDSMGQPSGRRKFADDRSPLQRLELTLDTITKEEKRALAEAAERAAREKSTTTARDPAPPQPQVERGPPVPEKGSPVPEKEPPTQQVRFSDRAPPLAVEVPKTRNTRPEEVTPVTPSAKGPLSQHPPEEGRRYSESAGVSPQTRAPESRIPLPAPPLQTKAQVLAQTSGMPQRNLSFRERAAKKDIKLPGVENERPTTPLVTTPGGTITRSGSNKLKKKPPAGYIPPTPPALPVAEDPWVKKQMEAQQHIARNSPRSNEARVRIAGPGGPGPAGVPMRPRGVGMNEPISPVGEKPVLLDQEVAPSAAVGQLSKTPSQRKAEQFFGGPTPAQNTSAQRTNMGQDHGPERAVMAGAAGVAVATAGQNHRVKRGDTRSDTDSSDDEHHHHVSKLIYGHGREKLRPGQGMYNPPTYLDEWKKATVGTLSGALLDLTEEQESATVQAEKDKAWWETPPSKRRGSIPSRPRKAEAFDGEYDDTHGMVLSIEQSSRDKKEWTDGEFAGCRQSWTTGYDDAVPPARQRVRPAPLGTMTKTKRQTNNPGPDASWVHGPCRVLCADTSPTRSDSDADKIDPFPESKKDTLLTKAIRVPIYVAPTRFKPPLYLRCGPLLRYCGIRTERGPSRAAKNEPPREREIWRGSVMIVTQDADSAYDIAPTLRLFVQPIELLPPPPVEIHGELAPEHVDPIAGHPKLGRKGETLYVRPIDHLEEAKDLSRDESDNGLFEKTRSPPDTPLEEGSSDPPGSFAARRKRVEVDGEKAGKYKDVRGFRLHAERGYTFWRFNIEVELQDTQQRIAYRINRGPSTGFWVPAKGTAMNIMFHSCNGFSLSVTSDEFSGPDPMWRDVLNTHQSTPFHVMVGGGDQIYNDAVMRQTKLFQDWLMIKNPLHKHTAPFTAQMQDELENFYLERYSMWFSQGLFGMANSQIPMVNMYDDHDIIDGFGSYPHHFMLSPVFSGLGNVAFKYYMLFQHQSIPTETEACEPSWTLGLQPGPYIHELSRSLFMSLGGSVALLAVDARTERTRDDVVSGETWKKLMDRCYEEIAKGKVHHLLVLMGVPIAYPRLVWLENILTSRVMDPIKALGKAGLLGNFLNKFDGGVEVLDDLDDHWTAKNHKGERTYVIEDLQDLAADKSIRVTMLSGDVHLAAVGQFYSNPKLGLAKHNDFRYMPNVISSAIVNTPPPDIMADILNKRNKIHHFDKETDEDMIPMFVQGVDGKPRNNKRLLPHRNWCSIRPYVPGNTPPASPQLSPTDRSPTRPSGIVRRLSKTKREPSFRGPDAVVDRSRPPVSSGLFRSFSRRRASVDDVTPGSGYPTPEGAPLKRTTSLSDRVGSFFRRRSSTSRPRDDGGINGTWGEESDSQSQSDSQSDDITPPEPLPRHQHQYTPSGPAKVSLRGGCGGGGFLHEYMDGDDSYFTSKPLPPPPSQTNPKSIAIVASSPPTPHHHQPQPPNQVSFAEGASEPDFRPKPFHRTPTTLSAKQMKRADALAVNLEGGLEICLNVEVSKRDPAGITVPYRLLVPRLWYEEEEDERDERMEGHHDGGHGEHQGGYAQGPPQMHGGNGDEGKGGGIKRFFSLRKKSVRN